MFEKRKLQKKINSFKKKIEEVEQKRWRSQAALVEAILSNKTASDTDVDYFNKYSAEINVLREQMQEMMVKFNTMK